MLQCRGPTIRWGGGGGGYTWELEMDGNVPIFKTISETFIDNYFQKCDENTKLVVSVNKNLRNIYKTKHFHVNSNLVGTELAQWGLQRANLLPRA